MALVILFPRQCCICQVAMGLDDDRLCKGKSNFTHSNQTIKKLIFSCGFKSDKDNACIHRIGCFQGLCMYASPLPYSKNTEYKKARQPMKAHMHISHCLRSEFCTSGTRWYIICQSIWMLLKPRTDNICLEVKYL